MQFAVPQFTEVEDRLIARLTLKQFLVLLGAGGIVFFFWSIFGPSFIFFILAVPVAIAGVAAALGKYNGRPMFIYLMPLAAFITSNRVMVFKRETVSATVSKSEAQAEIDKSPAKAPEVFEPAESRLKKLAYLLDNKTAEEGEIISHDFEKIIAPVKPMASSLVPKISTVNTLSRPIAPSTGRHNVTPARTAPKIAPTRKFDPNKIFNPNG